ncbi:MAG: hypothetical protein JWO38_195 [Gemmataceae bacterium]|nr:hypothetical protein [Gemmataceae bacterium]
MDGIYHELGRRTDPAKLLGYLNFSDGRPDPRFQKGLADAAGLLLDAGADPWAALPGWLAHALGELESSGAAAFRDTTQAKAVLGAALGQLPAAYRAHHADLLAHQPDPDLFTPFFLARACEAVLRQGPPWDQPDRLVGGAINLLNDYVGYRPIAVLETRPNTDYYPHEKVRPVPIYLQAAGVAPGRYADLVRPALELLARTEPVLLEEACFDPAKMDELAFDPRAHDHFHPVNKRPNVLFGEWDPHTIDTRGLFRRFVLRQMTLDTLLTWVTPPAGVAPGDRGERLFEAAAVLAGTVLMGAGVSGTGPNYYDSTITLSKLVPRIARYRDGFYQRLLKELPGPHGDRLREEAEKRKQPFAGVRQFLNQAIAGQRAAHLQDRRLAQLFAAMGYPKAARDQARKIPAPAVRFGTEIRVRQTEAEFAAGRGLPADALALLGEVEDLLRRGIDCGAVIDPWNILGYQGLFPIFPGREDTVRDPRAEDLIHTVGRQFELYARVLAAAAVAGDGPTRDQLAGAMRDLAAWWDRFATATVGDLPRIHGGERSDAAEHVANALAAWSKREPETNDLVFWRQHRDGFTSPAAFAQVIAALTKHREWRAAMALLMTWLAESETVPLEDPSASFDDLAERWLRAVVAAAAVPSGDRAGHVRRFFELLEANAEGRWDSPDHWLLGAEGEDEDEDEAADEADGNEFESAYEGMTFRDSADDGEEGAVAGGEPARPPGEFPLEAEADQLETRLKFFHTVARLWRAAASPDLWARGDPAAHATLAGWLGTARRNRTHLARFLDRVKEIPVPEPVGGHEGMIEFDRRRALKGHLLDLGVATCVETGRAATALSAVLIRGGELPAAGGDDAAAAGRGPAADSVPPWEPLLVQIERAIGTRDAGQVRKILPGFVTLFQTEPLLYCPPSDGGQPAQVLRAQTALHALEDLLTRLPRLGLVRETFHLTKLARQMEWNSPPTGRRVSSFDQLFKTALVGVVDTLLGAAADWGDEAGPDGPLAAMLFKIAEDFQKLWTEHSQSLRLSVLEAVNDDADWDAVRGFVTTYGGDLFTVPFLGLSNMRGILARGVSAWLDHEVENGDGDKRPKLVDAWEEGKLDRARTVRTAELALQALVEHYDEYRDYNTTTTQSDYGENIYILLDFLRLKVKYDRVAWRMRPFALAHEVLCRRHQDALAARWRDFIGGKTRQMSEGLLDELAKKETRYAVRLRTVRDRLEERFILPLEIDRAAAQVGPAAGAARAGRGEEDPAFIRLLVAMSPLGETVSGVGLEVPVWVRRLEDALRQTTEPDEPDADEAFGRVAGLDFAELKRQLQEWDKPLGE